MPALTQTRARPGYSLLLCVALATASLFAGPAAHGQNPTEFQLKAVFIYNFVNFVEWPPSAFEQSSDPFVIGVAGPDVFGGSLREAVAGEMYRGRPIELRHIANAADAAKCHMIYIGDGCDFFDQALAGTREKAILTIADTDNFMQEGGMIRFYVERNQLRMEINQRMASSHGLVISSKLLRLASVYRN